MSAGSDLKRMARAEALEASLGSAMTSAQLAQWIDWSVRRIDANEIAWCDYVRSISPQVYRSIVDECSLTSDVYQAIARLIAYGEAQAAKEVSR